MTIFENEEDDMHPTFERVMGERLKDDFTTYLYHEQRAGARSRVDFVAAHVGLDRAWKRVVTYGNDEGLPREYHRTYDTARHNCPLPVEELLERPYYEDEETALEAFEWLVDNNYLLEDSDGWYHFNYPNTVISGVTVYELKMHKWQDGLDQATTYKKMIGTEAYVVIDANRIGPAITNLDEFKQKNVGLMALTRNSLEKLYEPTPEPGRTPRSSDELLRLSERTFWKFIEENPPGDAERQAEDEIGQFQNPYKARRIADRIDEVRE